MGCHSSGLLKFEASLPRTQTVPSGCGTWIIRMSSQPESSTQETLAGLVERVTHHNGEKGLFVLRAQAPGQRDFLTVVGHVATISAREGVPAPGERGQQPIPD